MNKKKTSTHRQHHKKTQCLYCNQFTLFKEKGSVRISVARLIEWDTIICGSFCSLDCAIKYLQEAQEKKRKKQGSLRNEIVHLVNYIGDSSTACGEDVDDVKSRKEELTNSPNRATCEKCLDDYKLNIEDWKKRFCGLEDNGS